MTPYEAVRAEFDFPFELRPYQIDKVNAHGLEAGRSALYWEPGVGKTAGSTHVALYHSLVNGIEHWIVLMPPILLRQWQAWLSKISHKERGELSVVIYHGPPKKRRALNLDVDFILTTYGMLKNDYGLLRQFFEGRRFGGIADEAHAMKNIESDTYKAVRDMFEGSPLMPLTGTPLTKPGDAYAFIKTVAPTIYRNKRHFDQIHILDIDDYGNVKEWDNLDLLKENMQVNGSRILRREVQADLPPVIFTPILYDLSEAHYKLYTRIAEERLVELGDGREIDAISAQALRTTLQQIVLGWSAFDDNAGRPAALELIDETFEEIGSKEKLVVVAHYVRTNELLEAELRRFRAVAIYGGVSPQRRARAVEQFVDDPECRCMIIQPTAGGFGLDGLQHVCSEMLVVEAPPTAPPFRQVVARLDRDGQKNPVNCRIAVAARTVQVRAFRQLLENDAEINYVQGGFEDLKDAVYGR